MVINNHKTGRQVVAPSWRCAVSCGLLFNHLTFLHCLVTCLQQFHEHANGLYEPKPSF